ncbi:hypothetical protein N9K77_02060 [bacterium]|nr:hypothetical protein [bacterium]
MDKLLVYTSNSTYYYLTISDNCETPEILDIMVSLYKNMFGSVK